MPGALGLALLLLAAAALVFWHGEERIVGLSPGEFATLAGLAAVLLVVASSVVSEFRGRWLRGVQALLVWAAVILGLVAAYSYRFELQDVALRLAGEIAPGRVAVTSGGEVVVARRADGSFLINGEANQKPLSFIFDTGATTVVLTAESARALGLEPADRDYSVTVSTANGRTTAAPVTLERVAFGPIAERRVRALVARPGALRENLLGMSFLERLASFEVRQNRLILRARGA